MAKHQAYIKDIESVVREKRYKPTPTDYDIIELLTYGDDDIDGPILREFDGRLIICGGYAQYMAQNKKHNVLKERATIATFNDKDLYLLNGTWDDVKRIMAYYKPFSAIIGKSVIEFINDSGRYQIILRRYGSYSEIFATYDMAQCCFGYDGKKVFGTNIAKYCIDHKTIVIFGHNIKHSWYERVSKYRNRGFKYVELYGGSNLSKLEQTDPYNAFGECEILDFADNKGADFEIHDYIYIYRPELDYANITMAQFKALYGVTSDDPTIVDFWL